MTRFEPVGHARGVAVVTVASTPYAAPFYQALAYKRSTGVWFMRRFQGSGLPYQPMRTPLVSAGRFEGGDPSGDDFAPHPSVG